MVDSLPQTAAAAAYVIDLYIPEWKERLLSYSEEIPRDVIRVHSEPLRELPKTSYFYVMDEFFDDYKVTKHIRRVTSIPKGYNNLLTFTVKNGELHSSLLYDMLPGMKSQLWLY